MSKAFVAIAALIALVSLVTAALSRGNDSSSPDEAGARATLPAQSAQSTTAAVKPVPGGVLVDVVKIVDGDTIDVRANGTELRVRLYGVDTPERGDRCYNEATERTRALAGQQVQLVPGARLQDSFKRELRYVYTAAGESIDAALVREGFAKAWREDGAQRAALIALEERAQAAKTGCLWSAP